MAPPELAIMMAWGPRALRSSAVKRCCHRTLCATISSSVAGFPLKQQERKEEEKRRTRRRRKKERKKEKKKARSRDEEKEVDARVKPAIGVKRRVAFELRSIGEAPKEGYQERRLQAGNSSLHHYIIHHYRYQIGQDTAQLCGAKKFVNVDAIESIGLDPRRQHRHQGLHSVCERHVHGSLPLWKKIK